MPRPGRRADSIELLQGTLDLILLQTLRWGPQHGYAISRAIDVSSQSTFKVDTGSLYPALHRLEKNGWVASEWRLSDNKQRAKYYRLTAEGRRHLAAEQSRWSRFVEGMASLMAARKGEA